MISIKSARGPIAELIKRTVRRRPVLSFVQQKIIRMKCVVLCLLGLVAVSLAGRYTDRYDTVNLDEILANDRLLLPYLKCCLGEAKCTPEGKELKSHIREALETDCAKCTPAQRKGSERVISHLIEHKKMYWEKLKAKYDPKNLFAPGFEARHVASKS